MRRIGLGFEGGFSLKQIPHFAKVAEENGFDSVWFDEGLGGDAFSLATACIPTTRSINLGTSVTSVFTRSPTIIAMASATVNALSDGRFRLGLGSSHRVQVQGEHGLEYANPLSRIVETVQIVRKTTATKGKVAHFGEIFSIRGFEFGFRQYANGFPIYLGGVFENMLKKAGQIGDGVILTTCNLEQIKRSISWVKEGAERGNRDATQIDIANYTPCCASNDVEKAKREMKNFVASTVGYFPRYNRLAADAGFEREVKTVRDYWLMGDMERARDSVSNRLLDSMTITGRIEECRSKIGDMVKAGIKLPILFYHSLSEDKGADVEAFIQTIV